MVLSSRRPPYDAGVWFPQERARECERPEARSDVGMVPHRRGRGSVPARQIRRGDASEDERHCGPGG
ncbi:hypothetical protein HMPREF9004_0486 [Schaalia cardiffensis F0333]|uniref:Uncharacterized protein n=1 Tax=Schaalia cardiffensis F0333 TaxID=888050 RepID=N6X524_9ACTO|nr:hypothetical protein HMPREF9004_0486 [Schaalia cardiffensis F0333]